jgi:hypothetical protein
MRKKRKSDFEEFLDVLLDVVVISWRAGAVITGVLTVAALATLVWALAGLFAPPPPLTDPGRIVMPFVQYAYLLIPAGLLLIAAVFGWRTWQVYGEQQRF